MFDCLIAALPLQAIVQCVDITRFSSHTLSIPAKALLQEVCIFMSLQLQLPPKPCNIGGGAFLYTLHACFCPTTDMLDCRMQAEDYGMCF